MEFLCTADSTISHYVLASFVLSDLRRASFTAVKATSYVQNMLVEGY